LAYGEGILVVPTNAGAVFGVDALSGTLLWAYPYREAGGGGGPAVPPPPPIGFPRPGFPPAMGTMTAYWQVTAPAIAEGKVVCTAPDGRNIHCVSIRDGSRQWHAAREDGDLYFAGVFGGKAIIVGEKTTRALSLKTGQIVWRLETGKPSGQGAASNT